MSKQKLKLTGYCYSRLRSGILRLVRRTEYGEQRTGNSALPLKKFVFFALCSLLFALPILYTRAGTPERVHAATSSNLNFQARLLQSGGAIVTDGNYDVEFKLYNVSTGGAALWTETRTGANQVEVRSGYLSVYLGEVSAFPTINWDQDLWLTMNVNGDGEMSPRLKLTAVPYAFAAGQLAKYNGTQTGTLGFNSVTNSPNILLPNIAGTNNVLLQSGTTLFTQGSVPFVDANGRLTQDNTNFFFNDTTNRLGIGTNNPGSTLEVAGEIRGDAVYVDTAGSLASPAVRFASGLGFYVPATDTLSIVTASTERIQVQADGDVAFDTSTLFVDAVNNRVGIGDTTPTAALTVGSGDLFQVSSAGAISTRNTSAAALQVFNAGSTETVLTVDTNARGVSGGNLIKVGNSTGTDTATTLLQLDSATADLTSNLSALNGSLYYNSTDNAIKAVINGAIELLCTDSGNCAGVGGGITAPVAGTTGRIPVFTNPFEIGDSWLNQSGTDVQIDSTKGLSLLGGNLSVTGNGTLTGTLGVNGSVTLGDAATDALTINAGVLSVTNAATLNLANGQTSALNVESGLLNIDTQNGRIGIGTTLPSAKLDVVGTTNTVQLKIRANPTQTSDLLQLTASNGTTVYSGFNNTGQLYFRDQTSGHIARLSVQNGTLTATRDLTFPDAGGEICTSAGNCVGNGGSGDVFKNGQTGPLVIGTNNATSFFLETNNVNRIEIQGDGDISFDSNTLFVDAVNNEVGIGLSGDPSALLAVGGTTGNFTVDTLGNVTTSGTLAVAGAVTFDTTLDVTGAAALAGTLDVVGAVTLDSTLDVTGDVAIGGTNFTVDADTGNTVTAGDLAVNGGAITSTAASFDFLNTDVLTANLLGAATTIELGATTGTTSINNSLTVDGTTSLAGTLTVTDGTLDITTGTAEDLTVEANGAGIIDLNDIVRIGTLAAADTDSVAVCRDASTGQLSACNTSGVGAAFVQGGNSFGTEADLGTNDTFALNFRTDGATRLTLDTTGNLTFNQASTLSVAANTTADGAGFGLTINAGAADGTTTGNTGGTLTLSGGNAAGTGDNDGGNVIINGGTATGSGAAGNILLQSNGGNVGIGLSGTPSALLSVGGTTGTFTVDGSGNVVTTGTYNTNTFNGSTLTFGSAATATISSAAGQALDITGNAASVISTTAGNLTVSAGGTGNLILNTGSGTIQTDADTLQRSGADGLIFDLADATTTTLTITNSDGTNVANLAVEGRITATGGLTVSGADSSINENSDFDTNINTGTSSGTITLGGGAAALIIDSTTLDLDASGNLTTPGNLTVQGTGANTFSGQVVFAGVATDITTGTDEDLTVVANGAGIIDLNDIVRIGTLGATDTDAVICRNAAGQLAACDSTFLTAGDVANSFVQGGNSFNAVAVLGTNDAFNLELETAGVTRLTLDQSGNATLTGDLTVSGTGTSSFAGDLTVGGTNFTIDADTGDTATAGDLAVNGGDITSTGALNITPGGALTVGAVTQTATIQGTVTTITSNGAGNDIILDSADSIELQGTTNVTGDFTVSGNADIAGTLFVGTGDAFQVDASGNITTSGDLALNGGDLTSTGALNITPGGALTVGTAGQTTLLQGSVVSITSNGATNDITLTSADQIVLNSIGTIELQDSTNVTGDFTVSGNADIAGTLAVGTDDAFTVAANGDVVTEGTLAVNGGSITSTSATLIVDAGGAIDLQDAVTADSLTIDTGSVTFTNGVATDITTGTDEDLTVVANGAGIIDLNDIVRVGTLAAADTDSALVCRDASTGQLSTCNTTGDGAAFVQGGNSFNAVAVLGTNDAFNLELETAGVTRLTIDQSGNATLTGDLTVQGTGTSSFAGSISLAANQTLRLTGGTTVNRPASPTEGMLFYDTDTKQLLLYNGTKWIAESREAYLVAANDSSAADKAAADYIADGTSDEDEINAALDRANPASVTSGARKSGKVYLFAGTYVADGTILVPNNTTLAGAGRGTVIELADIDATDNLIENSDTSTGTGITIQDLRLDGRDDLNTAGVQNGIHLNGMGAGSGSTARQGAKLTNLWAEDFRTSGFSLDTSSHNILTGNNSQGNSGGFLLQTSSHNILTGNNSQGNNTGFDLRASTNNILTGNNSQGNSSGFSLTTSSNNNVMTGNKAHDSGGSTSNNGFILSGSDANTITGNDITDTSCTTTCYAINISNVASDNNYLADNRYSSPATINNIGTGTIFGGQLNGSNFQIQPAGTIELVANTNVTGNLDVSGTLSIGSADQFQVSAAGELTFNGVATDITTGTDEDLTVVANGAGIINLDDTVRIGTLAVADTDSYAICRDASGGQLSACDANATGRPFLQGGNSFGATAVLGTNDAFNLQLETAGVTRLTLDQSGNATLTGNLTVQGTGTSTFAGNLTIDGNTTLGDDVSDTLTITGTAVSMPNSLNFDSNTLYIDSANDRVGIGTDTPKVGYALDVRGQIGVFGSLYNVMSADASLSTYGYFRAVNTSDTVGRFEIGAYDISGVSQGARDLLLSNLGGNVGIGADTTPDARLHIQGVTDDEQLIVQGNGTQTSDIFQVKNSGGTVLAAITGTGILKVGTTAAPTHGSAVLFVTNGEIQDVLRVGDATNRIETDATTQQLRYFGTARNSLSVTLAPEFAGATLTGDGSGNTGTMSSDFCSNGGTNVPNLNTGVCTATESHNYYSWTTTQGTAQDYDVWLKWQVPSNFDAWDTTAPAPVQFNGWRTNTSQAVTVTFYNSAGAACGTASISGTVATWNLTNLTPSCTPTAGQVMTIRVQLSATSGSFARVGEIFINYLSKF